MPVTLSSPQYTHLAFAGLSPTQKHLPNKNSLNSTSNKNQIRFGMDRADGQDSVELTQRRMEEGTLSEVPLDSPRTPVTDPQYLRRHGLDLRRDLPQPTTAPANAQTPEQQADSEPTAPTTIPSRLFIAANGLFATALAGLGGPLALKGVAVVQDADLYAEPEGLVKTAGVLTSIAGIGAIATGMLLVKRAFSLYSERKEALQAQAQQPNA